jgi:tetratricopeptide (TPR) repeat protein
VVNKEAFHKLLQDPAHITPDSLASLEELVRLFPFCSLAHTLIAKSHYDQATMLASQKVRKAAAYAVNRNKLKKIITGHWPEPPRVELPPVFRPLGPETQPEALILPPLPPLEVTAPELFATETAVHETAVPQALSPEMPTPQPEAVEAEPVAEAPAVPEEPLLIEPPADLLFERLVGTLQPPPPPPAVYPSPEAEEEEEPEEPPLQLGHLNEDDQPIEEYSRRTKKYQQREIIESFIKSEPRISSLNNAVKESYTPRDLSEKSTRPLEVVSENMANIYIRQRKYDKAIQMFNKLILKYPEKMENFVKRIEELKQL